MRRLVCAFVVRKTLKTQPGFLATRPICAMVLIGACGSVLGSGQSVLMTHTQSRTLEAPNELSNACSISVQSLECNRLRHEFVWTQLLVDCHILSFVLELLLNEIEFFQTSKSFLSFAGGLTLIGTGAGCQHRWSWMVMS